MVLIDWQTPGVLALSPFPLSHLHTHGIGSHSVPSFWLCPDFWISTANIMENSFILKRKIWYGIIILPTLSFAGNITWGLRLWVLWYPNILPGYLLIYNLPVALLSSLTHVVADYTTKVLMQRTYHHKYTCILQSTIFHIETQEPRASVTCSTSQTSNKW